MTDYTVRYTVAMLLGALLILMGIPSPAEAQLGDRVRDRAQRQVERRVEQRAAEAVDTALDAVECAVTDQRCVDRARSSGHEVVLTDEQGQRLGTPATTGSTAVRPGEGAWVNYDFVPGERVIFAEDFTRDRVGDFPRRLEFQRGNMEVAEWQGQRWLRATTARATFLVNLPETLPERFTLELDFVGAGSALQWIYFGDETRGQRQRVEFHSSSAGISGGGLTARGQTDRTDEPRTLRVMADGRYVKVYLDETRLANVPNADLGRRNQVRFELGARDRSPMMLSNLRIAAGGRELYDALTAEGRVVTQGILFDTGSDRIRPESTPTLQEIGEMLRRHGDLRLRIEGHTDSVGDAAMNKALSARRAESVRRFLVQQYGIDANRLEASGLGQARPVDSNDTPEGRQNNRRVELVRL